MNLWAHFVLFLMQMARFVGWDPEAPQFIGPEYQLTHDRAPPVKASTFLDRIVIVARHGDRAPLERYPWDGRPTLWKHGYGHLTKHGKHRMHRMGVFLRDRYARFFPRHCILPRDFHIRSSSVDRCLETAQLLTAGLSPPRGNWRWDSTTPSHPNSSANVLGNLWQPIPIYSVPRAEDGLLVQRSKCPRAIALYSRILDSPAVQAFMAPFEPLLAELHNTTKVNIKNHRQVRDIYDSLLCLQHYINEEGTPTAAMRKALAWFTEEQLAALKFIFERSFQFDFTGAIEPELRRLRSGLLLEEIFTRLDATTPAYQDPEAPRMNILSTHDSSMFHLLESLGLAPTRSLKFGTTFLFEARAVPEANDTAVAMYMVDARQSSDPFSVKRIPLPGGEFNADEMGAELFKELEDKLESEQSHETSSSTTAGVRPSSTSVCPLNSSQVHAGSPGSPGQDNQKRPALASLRKLRRHYAHLLVRDMAQWREECEDLSGIEWAYYKKMAGRDEL